MSTPQPPRAPDPARHASDAARPAGTVGIDPDAEPTRREHLATLLERRLDIPMAVLAVAWAALVAYELVAPASQRRELGLAGNVVWGVFVLEFLVRVAISGRPWHYTVRHWFSVLILLLPALRLLRVTQALRLVRILPAARVIGSSYRAVGTARSLLQGRLTLLLVVNGIVAFGGGQLLYVLERGRDHGLRTLGEALYWSTSLAITNTRVFEPVTVPGRVLALGLSLYAVVVVAAVAATLGAFFVESRAEATEAEQ